MWWYGRCKSLHVCFEAVCLEAQKRVLLVLAIISNFCLQGYVTTCTVEYEIGYCWCSSVCNILLFSVRLVG